MARNLINGAWVDALSGKTFDVVNPATLERVDAAPAAGPRDVDAAVDAARKAWPAWAATPAIDRGHLLHDVARRMRKAERRLSTLMTLETGKPLIESVDCIDWCAACFDYYAEVGRNSRGASLPPVAPHQVAFTVKEPYGVVAAIAPFNFPLLLMVWKVAPALMAGNTLVCKPSTQNPLSNLLLAELYDRLPPGVVNVITGPEANEALISHPGVNVVAFTGSTEVGRHIGEVAGRGLKKTVLELGGIDPFIVFADADLDAAVPGAVFARFLNAGQVCTSAKRFYVDAAIHDAFVARVLEQVRDLKLGNPMDPTVDMGPLVSPWAVKAVEDQVARLKAEGATLLLGGHRCQPDGLPGHFYAPTVFVDVKHGGIATTEEIFGPVMSIIKVDGPDQAIAMANDSEYGLGANLYTNDLRLAMKAMESIKAGTFWINDPLTDNDAGPFGGMRASGLGRELGEEGLDAFRETKHVHMDYIQERKSFWYPYRDRPIPPDPETSER